MNDLLQLILATIAALFLIGLSMSFLLATAIYWAVGREIFRARREKKFQKTDRG